MVFFSQSVQSLSHAQLCDPMDCIMPGFPVHHQLLELAQTHVHRVSDAITYRLLQDIEYSFLRYTLPKVF